jgi:dGTPase
VLRQARDAGRVVTELFRWLLDAPEHLPPEWRNVAKGRDKPATARLVADYIAGMTDRYALQKHDWLKDRIRTTV